MQHHSTEVCGGEAQCAVTMVIVCARDGVSSLMLV